MKSGFEKLAEKMKLTSKDNSDDAHERQSEEHDGEGSSHEHRGKSGSHYHHGGGSSHEHQGGGSSHERRGGGSSHEHRGGGSSHEHRGEGSSHEHRGEGSSQEHKGEGSSHEHHEEGSRHEHHGKGGSREHHGGHVPACPVLIERSGASQTSKFEGKSFRVTIVASHWYEKVVHSLVDACSKELLAKGVGEDNLHVVEVAGAFELPFTAARLIASEKMSHRPDAVICIGCFVEDATHTCETMRQAVAHGIMKLNVTSDVPVIFGVLCCDNESQAHSSVEKRSCYGIDDSEQCNFGVSWAQSALQMAHLSRCTSVKEMEHCSCFRSDNRSGGDSDEHKRKLTKHESGKHESGKHESGKLEKCTSCGLSEKKCSCKECVCKACCDHGGACTSCKSSAENCECKDCKCRSCCVRRDACRRCGCPPDSCSCQGCDCAVCSGKDGSDAKTKSSKYTDEHESTKASSGGHSKEESASGSGSGIHVSSVKCDRCGSPSGGCQCGLLH
uniref:6,7-dimethyl-8-ribityllumazine synthase n=1 Tax=Peronospora matthiolae TaxID=2874970 RepID=A0AAV1VGH6_9STRA